MCIIAMKTVTAAMRAKGTLRSGGVFCDVISLDATLTKNGCAYGLSLEKKNAHKAVMLLERARIGYGEIIGADV